MRWQRTILPKILATSALVVSAVSGTSAATGSAALPGPADAPKFSFSQESLRGGVLSHHGLIKAAGRSLQFSKGSDLAEQSWLSVPSAKFSRKCVAARKAAERTYPGDAFGGYVFAHDGVGSAYGTGFFVLDSNATVRSAIAKTDTFFSKCSSQVRGEFKIATSKSSTRGGFGLRVRGTLLGQQNAVLYQTIAGYGNVFLYGIGPTQVIADRVIAAERKRLNALAPSQ